MAGPNDNSSDPEGDGEDDEVFELTDDVRSIEPEESERSDVRTTQRMEAVASDDLDEEHDPVEGREETSSTGVLTPRGGVESDPASGGEESSPAAAGGEERTDARHERVLKTIQMKAVDRSMLEREGQLRQLEGTLPLLSNRFAPDVVVASPDLLVRDWSETLPGGEGEMADEETEKTEPVIQSDRVPEDQGPRETLDLGPEDAEEETVEPPSDQQPAASGTPTSPPEEWAPPGSEEQTSGGAGDDHETGSAPIEEGRAPRSPPESADAPAHGRTTTTEESGASGRDETLGEGVDEPSGGSAPGVTRDSPTAPGTPTDEETADEPTDRRPTDESERDGDRGGLGGTWIQEAFGEQYLMTIPSSVRQKTRREADFIESMLSLDEGDQILDLACGYGRHTVELAERGHDIAGFDLSQPLLEKGLAETERRSLEINFFLGDMRGLTFADAFDACFCWQTSFGYYPDRTNLEILARINRSLRSGGRFLLDVMNRDFVVQDMPHRRWWEGPACVFLEEGEFDHERSVLHLNRTFVSDDREIEHDYYVRLYSRHELAELLDRAGFRVHDVTGDLAHPGYFLGPESQRLIVSAEKVTSVLD